MARLRVRKNNSCLLFFEGFFLLLKEQLAETMARNERLREVNRRGEAELQRMMAEQRDKEGK